MNTPLDPTLSISAVERETGLSKDVLRKWETRYGFPVPLRDSTGERAYPLAQVDRLRLIKRLMDGGMRPSRLISESDENLYTLEQNSQLNAPHKQDKQISKLTLEMLHKQDPESFRQLLFREVLIQGIERFVLDTIAPLNNAVGDAWARGELSVHEEHLYTEAVQCLLRDVICKLSNPQGSPRVLLTTLPEEQHGLGLLMLSTLLSLHGAYCISLGTQTPVQDIVAAADLHQIDLLALSFSNAYPQRRILPALAELRQRLPTHCGIWAGGNGVARLHTDPAGLSLLPTMEQALAALATWNDAHPE